MFPLLMPMLIGAGIGAIANKKDPLKGAVLGAGLGAAGGTLAPGLLAGGSGSAAATAGLLAPNASAAAGSQAAMLAAQNEGFGAIGQQMLAQSAGTAAPASLNLMAGLQKAGETATQFGEKAKPFMQAAQSAQQVQGLLAQPGMTPPPAPVQSQPLDLSGVLSANQQEMAKTFEEDMKRRQSMGAFAQYAMGAR